MVSPAVAAQLESGARPTALAAGDFDRDGVPDLVAAFEVSEGGILVLHRGNLDAIFPHAPAARARRSQGTFSDRPFHPAPRVFAVPVAPDFIGAGDFDNDGDLDIVAAALGGRRLQLMAGDGRGGLQAAATIRLPGPLTTMATGEFQRADRLADIVVATEGREGPAVSVFQDPTGAFRSSPATVELPAPATSLLLGRLDDDSLGDLAVGAGPELLLFSSQANRDSTPTVGARFNLSSPVASIAEGDFASDAGRGRELAVLTKDGTLYLLARPSSSQELAAGDGQLERSAAWSVIGERTLGRPGATLLPGRTSGSATDDLVLVGGNGSGLPLLAGVVRQPDSPGIADWGVISERTSAGRTVAALPMRLGPSALDDLVLLDEGATSPAVSSGAPRAVITVNSPLDTATAGDGDCELREAIDNANTNSDTTLGDCLAGSGTDDIGFNIGGGGALATIRPLSALPAIIDPVTINGNTQGCAAPPCIELDGSLAGASVNGLVLSGVNNTIRGLAINRFASLAGIRIESDNNIVEGNFLGTDSSGTVALPNNAGIRIQNAGGNTVGGTVPEARNVMSGNNADGLFIFGASNNNVVLGNYIGTDVTGTVDLGNLLVGFEIQGNSLASPARFNTLGGTAPEARNVVSGNDEWGILLDVFSADTEILGNYIGTDVTGTVDLGNLFSGIEVGGPLGDHRIGGTAAGAGNVISGNEGDGVFIQAASSGNDILGNFIGTDASGTLPLGNTLAGVEIQGLNTTNNNVGDAIPGAGNVISANGDRGVLLETTALNEVLGNHIGTDVTGTVDLGNTLMGVHILNAADNTVGGATLEARNVIAGNDQHGVLISVASTRNEVLGNFIGVDAGGTVDLGNALAGVRIVDSPDNRVGDPVPGGGNVISGNGGNGVAIAGAPSSLNLVQGNFIGTDVGGRMELGNDTRGVIVDGASNNVIGGANDGEGNRIAYNLQRGVVVRAGGVGNSILRNSIDSNGLLGIDLAEDGVTANDAGDPDTGANGRQNYPVLSAASATPTPDVTVDGSLNSTGLTTFRIEFFASKTCDGAGFGEGDRFLGFTTQSTNAAGNVSFSVLLPAPVSDGETITATATDELDNTSEFTECLPAGCSGLVAFPHTITAPDKGVLEWPAPEDIKFAKGDLANVSSYATIDDGFMMGVTLLDISADNPGPGDGLYYVVKPLGCGSWQTSLGAEPGREGGLP